MNGSSNRQISAVALPCAIVLLFSVFVNAQSYIYSVGAPNFTTALPVESGFINVPNGNLHLEIPLGSWTQRGTIGNFNASLVYDSRIWEPGNGVDGQQWYANNVPSSKGGWRLVTSADVGSVSNHQTTTLCYDAQGHPNAAYVNWDSFQWTDPGGITHPFSIGTEHMNTPGCGSDSPTGSSFASDGSEFYMSVSSYNQALIYAPNGMQVYPGITDTNGNYYSRNSNNDVIDTLGRTPITTVDNCNSNSNQTCYKTLNSQTGNTPPSAGYTVTYTTVNANTAFNLAGTPERINYPVTVVDTIGLPDGSSYHFTYDAYAEVASVQLPTGAIVSYGYGNLLDAYGNINRWVTSRDSGGGHWVYSALTVLPASSCETGSQFCQQIVVTKPNQDKITYVFSMTTSGAWNTQAQYSGATSGVAATVTATYDLSSNPLLRTQTTSLTVPGGVQTKQVEYDYDGYNNVSSVKEWNFGRQSPATPDRQTDISYTGTLPNYPTLHILNLPVLSTEYQSGVPVAQTNFDRDTTTGLIDAPGVSQHISGYDTTYIYRGNITSIRKWVSGASCTANTTTCLTTNLTYDTAGQLRQIKDVNGNVTAFDYTDKFYNDDDQDPPGAAQALSAPTDAYVTKVTLPMIGDQTIAYYLGSGKVAFTTDQNGATSYAHFMDALDRLTRTKDATAGWKVFSHPSTTEQDTYTGITDATPSVGCNGCRHDQMIFDGLARLTRSSVVNDPDGQINTDIGYDTNGRANAVSNPYRPGTPDTTDGVTTLRFDALDRIDQTTQPDNTTLLSLSGAALGGGYSQVCNNGAGYPNLKVDERGNKRLLWSDGLDRLIEVDEQSSPGGALNWATCYQYTVSGNSKVTTVTQKGGSTNSADWRVRTFVYDPASRLTSAATPEGGATTYSYLGSSGFCAGDQTLPCTRTDARRVTTTYSYDALNRLTGKSYSATTPPTPSVTYFYDQPSYNGLTIVNGQGRRTGMLDGSGKTAWSYDAMGRVVAKAQTISPDGSGLASMNEMTLYSPYNYDGSVSAVTYPSNRVVSYAYNQSQRAVSATDNTSIYTHFVSSAHYDAPGMLTSATHGDGINDINHFNNRIQPTLLSAASGSQSLLNLTYGYQQTTPSIANNGTVLQMVNGLRNPGDNRSLAFTYDQVNRLQTAGTLSDATSPWTTTYSYDPWGNLYQKSTTGTGAGNGEVNQGPFSVDNHNRLNPDTFAYDAAGNMQSDIYNPLNFDGENQVHPASGIQYYYDGDGHRVAKSDGSRYWYDDNFKVLFTADASNTLKRDYFYFNGTRLGWVTVASGDAHYYLNDHLGSPRVIANGDGSFIGWEADYRPYGQDNVISNNDGLDVFYLSTGYEYDYEMNPDADYYANLRYMSASLGRFFQPDPVGGDPTNPQSWNRYAYVLNSPCTLYDQLGLDVCTLNIGLTGTSHLSDPNLLALEQNLRKLFAGADVNLSFSSGTGDLNLQLVKGEYNFLLSGTPSGVLGYTDASTRTSAVALDRIGPSIIATSRVSAHELGHAILWLSHTTGSPDFRQGIMQSGTALSALLYSNSADANAAYQFTPLQQQGIKAFCKLKHGNSSNGGGGGQDRFNDDDGGRFEGIGSEFDWLDLLYGPKPYHGIR